MRNLLYKEFSLSINRFFLLVPVLTSALFLIPQWVFFIALMYFFWISVPNILSTYNAQNDISFSIMMPVKKSDIVGSKVLAFVILELLHLVTGMFFAYLNTRLYHTNNFLLDLTPAFFGIAFIMFGLFNITLFPMYFRTAYAYGLPTIAACVVTLLFVAGVEALVLVNRNIAYFLEGTSSESRLVQWIVLVAGIVIFALLNIITVKISSKRFEKVNL